MKLKQVFLVACVTGLLAACGGGGSSVPGPRQIENPSPTPGSNPPGTSAVFVIRIPAATSSPALVRMHPLGFRSPTPSITPDYVSPSTQSISISVNGAKPVVANLTPASPNCTPPTNSTPLTCSVTAPAPPGTDTFVVTTYDKTGATGNKLATASVTPPPIVLEQANSVFITMNGIVASIVLALQGQASEGTPTTIGLSVMAEDADGNIIISPGVYNNGAISLTDSDNSGNTSFSSNGVKLPNPTSITQPTNTLSLTYDGLGVPSATITASESGVSKITNATLAVVQKFKEYALPAGTQPWGLTVGPDGNIWFVGANSASVGNVNPSSGTVNPSVASLTSGSKPQEIVAGPDGNLWLTENQGNFIDGISTAGAVIKRVAADAGGAPYGITVGDDGNIWFTEENLGLIGTFIPSNPVLTDWGGSSGINTPVGIIAGPNGSVWFTAKDQIGQVTPTGTVSTYALASGSNPLSITTGPDGKLWFTEFGAGSIGWIDPTNPGNTQVYPLPTGSAPHDITGGPDGNLWFTDSVNSLLGMINPATDIVTELFIPTLNSTPLSPIAGPDGNLWFSESGKDKIGVYLRSGPTATPQTLLFGAQGQTANFSVSENNYGGSFTASSSNLNCATVANSGTTNTFTVTAVASTPADDGFFCTITALDSSGNAATVAVQIGTTTITIQGHRHRAL